MSKCPQCGHGELLTRNGRYGEFLGCSEFPDCKYTKSLGSFTYVKPECPFKSCDGSGKLPFTKNGRIVPHAFVDCECQRPEETNRIPRLRDFDFAMSDSFRAASFSYCGFPDPAESLAELHEKQEIEKWGEYIVNGKPPEHPSSQEIGQPQIGQVKAELAHVHTSIHELQARKAKPKSEPKFGHKGIS